MSHANVTTRFGVFCSRQKRSAPGEQRAGGRAGENRFLLQQLARDGERFRVGNAVSALGQREVADRRDEVLADAFDQPRALLRHLAGRDVLREDRALRIGEHQLDVRRVLLEERRQPADRAAGADAEHDGIEPLRHLLPDFRPGRFLVRLGIVGIAELVDEVSAGALGDRGAEILVVLRVTLRDVGAREHDFRAHRAQVEDLLLAHLVGQHQDQPIALLRGDQRQTKTGVAGGRFDDRAAGLEVAALLGLLDHRQADAVLDGAAGIRVFELQEQLARPGIEAVELQHRRLADHFDGVLIDAHGESPESDSDLQ